jgi:hypothetical protein
MELVQWIVALDDGRLAVAWAPEGAERLPALAGTREAVQRRGVPVSSRWLPWPLCIGVGDAAARADAPLPAALRDGALAVAFALAADGPGREPLLSADADDVRFAGLFAELVRVIADLAEAAGLPALAIAPGARRDLQARLEVRLGAVGAMSAAQLADALLLFRVGVEICAQARGLQVTDARLERGAQDGAGVPLDGHLVRALAANAPPKEAP